MLWKILDFHVACCSRSDNSEGPFCLVVFNVVGLSLSPACDFWVQFGSSQFVLFFAEIAQALQE